MGNLAATRKPRSYRTSVPGAVTVVLSIDTRAGPSYDLPLTISYIFSITGVTMGEFGDRLRRERELRGITLQEISESTKISKKSLEALENEEFEELPGGGFNPGRRGKKALKPRCKCHHEAPPNLPFPVPQDCFLRLFLFCGYS